MKRLSFIAGLLGIGIAKAQKSVCIVTKEGEACGNSEVRPLTSDLTGHLCRDSKGQWGACRYKPRNGECPACGTMADPYKPEPDAEQRWRQFPTPTGTGFRLIPEWVDITPTSRRIDCAHCGCTFKQEAEKA